VLGTQRYCKFILLSVICLFISFSPLYATSGFDLSQYLSKTTQGEDPEQPDTLYFICQRQSFDTWVIHVRLKTDNLNAGDSVIGAYIPLVITADKPGVVLDTTVTTTYTGTPLASWDVKVANVFTPGNLYPGDPKVFPMHLLIGGHDAFDAISHPIGKGDYLLAKLVFSVSEPTTICVDTTSEFNINEPLLLVTTNAMDYLPQWRGGCCVPGVPSLSQWGLFLFGFLLLAYLTWFFYRRRKLSTPTAFGIFLLVFTLAFYISYTI